MNKDQILNAADVTIVPVEIPEWGGTCHVRSLDGIGRAQFAALCVGKAGDPANARYMERLLVCTLCDEGGARLFDGTEEEVLALSLRSAGAITKLWNVTSPLNGIGTTEDAKGNS